MRTMLWKEWRQARPKLLFGLGFLILLQIWRASSVDYDRWFLEQLWQSPLYTIFSLIFSITVGIDTIAGERSNGTLDFVLTKPVSVTRLLIAKISIGTAILLMVHILFWTAMYTIPSSVTVDFPATKFRMGNVHHMLQLIDQVPGYRIFLLAFPLIWLFYALAVTWSTVVENQSLALAGGALSFSLFLTGATYFEPTTLLAPWDPAGHVFSHITSNGYLLSRASFIIIPGILLICASTTYLNRLKEPIGLRTLGVVFAGFLVLTFSTFAQQSRQPRYLVGSVEPQIAQYFPGQDLRDLLVEESTAYLVLKNGLAAIDVSNPIEPKELYRVEVNQFRTTRVKKHGDRLFVFGRGPSDHPKEIGLMVFDASDPARLRERSRTVLYEVSDGFYSEDRTGLNGSIYYQALHGDSGLHIGMVDVTGSPKALPTRIQMTEGKDTDQEWQTEPGMRLALKGSALYASTALGLTTFDVSEPLNPVRINHISFGDEHDSYRHRGRPLVVAGDRLYIWNSFPESIRTYDISLPLEPTLVRELLWREDHPYQLSVSGDVIFSRRRRDVIVGNTVQDDGTQKRTLKIALPWARKRAREVRRPNSDALRQGSPIYVKDGYLIGTQGSYLVVHPMPTKK